MPNCFDNLISIRGACTETSATLGMYLDDFGISLRECESYVTKDYENAEDFVLKKISSAGKIIASEIQRHFMGKMLTRPIVENSRVGYYLDNMQTDTNLSATMKGVQMNVYAENSFLDLFIDYIELFVDITGNVDVKIYDLYQNKLIDTITVSCTANQISRKIVGKKYPTYRHDMKYAIVYDASTISGYKTGVTSTSCGTCEGKNYYYECGSFVTARGVTVGTATDKVDENMSGVNYTGGLSVGYSLSCNYDLWICSVGQALALPLIYKAGSIIMFSAINETDRINTRTTINIEQAKKKYDWFETMYREQMNMLLPNMRIPSDNLCFECFDRVRTRIALP